MKRDEGQAFHGNEKDEPGKPWCSWYRHNNHNLHLAWKSLLYIFDLKDSFVSYPH